MLDLEFIQPHQETLTVKADTGADIDAIDAEFAFRHYKDEIKTERKPFTVHTGNGDILCKDYVPFTINNNGSHFRTKFYLVWDAPYNLIAGSPILEGLDYRLIKWGALTVSDSTDHYYHPREILDGDDAENPNDVEYPREHDPTLEESLDFNKLNISDRAPSFRDFIKDRLKKYAKIVSRDEVDSGLLPGTEFKIKFKHDICTLEPIRCPEYPHNFLHTAEIERQLGHLMRIGFISPSDSPWRFPTFIVPKKNGEARIVFDYRLLNGLTEKMAYSLPSMEQLIAAFKGKTWISTIDLKSGFWHIPVREEDRKYTAFVFNSKLYHWNRMPFGTCNAPPTFQKAMAEVFQDMEFVMVYIDDIAVLSTSQEEHERHLDVVFQRLEDHGIKIRPDKCAFGVETVEYLGFDVGADGLRVTDNYKGKIQNMPTPTDKPQLKRWIGMVQFINKFIPDCSIELKPFHKLATKQFHWNNEYQQKFDEIKEMVQNADILRHPDMEKEFKLYCDASADGMGAVLTQEYDGVDHPVQFSSKVFSDTQSRWHCSEQEIFSVVYHVEKFRPFLVGKPFTIFTDHKNLESLFNKARNYRTGKLYRWAVRLQEYEFVATHVRGKDNYVADYLSRDALHNKLKPTHQRRKKRENTSNILMCYQRHLARTILNEHHIGFFNTSKGRSFCILRQNPLNLLPNRKAPAYDDVESVHSSDSEMDEPDLSTKQSSVENVTIEIPDHQFNTRHKQQQQRLVQQRVDVSAKLKVLEDTTDAESGLDAKHLRLELENEQILQNKPTKAVHNKSLLFPDATPIEDTYDVTSLSDESIEQKQRDDPQLFAIIQYIWNNNAYLIQDLSRYVYRTVLSGRYFVNNRRLLSYKYKDRECVVIPRGLRFSALNWAHDIVHHGRDKMMRRLTDQAHFWWPGMRHCIAEFSTSCHECQLLNKGGRGDRRSGKMKAFPAAAPFELISVDLVGPLPETVDGFRYIFTSIDKFTRFCRLIPIKDMKTMSILKAWNEWLSLFGPPASVLSDNGSQFVSVIWDDYNKQFGIKMKRSSPYWPEGNGQIERLHRWLKQRLTLISVKMGLNFVDGLDDWSSYLPMISHCYNSTPNSMTKYSPNKLIFGDDLKMVLDRVNETEISPITHSEYIRLMENQRRIIHNDANVQQRKYDARRSKSYNKGRGKQIEYEVGDKVLVDISRRYVGNKKKFRAKWHGPFEIIEIRDKQIICAEVDNEVNVKTVNINQIKPYNESPYLSVLRCCIKSNSPASARAIQHVIHKMNQ